MSKKQDKEKIDRAIAALAPLLLKPEDLVVDKDVFLDAYAEAHGIWPFYIDEDVNTISPKWWHKLVFWKKWVYPTMVVKRRVMTRKQVIKEFKR